MSSATGRWRTLGGPLAPPRRWRAWVVVGVLLQVVASAVLIYCAAHYGNRATLPHGVVAALIVALVVELVGAVVLSRALAPGRAWFVIGVPLFFVWPVLLVVLAAAWILTLSWGDTLVLAHSAGTSGRRKETRRGRRRRERRARQSRSRS